MFTSKPTDKTELEKTIDTLHAQMAQFPPHSDEYTKITDNLSKLYKLREHDARKRVSPDTIALVAGNLAGIAMILGHERAHVVTSKALGFVLKLK